MVNLLVCAPLAVEAMALRERAHMRVVRTGMGADRSRRAAAALALEPARAVSWRDSPAPSTRLSSLVTSWLQPR